MKKAVRKPLEARKVEPLQLRVIGVKTGVKAGLKRAPIRP